MAPKVVYLHVGAHKSGTTYLQNALRINRKALRAQDVYYPAGKGQPNQGLAVADLQGRRLKGQDDVPVAGAWQNLVDAVNASQRRVAVVSREALALSTLRHARTAAGAFPDSDVHVIVTVRDLARVLVSMWQEEVKSDHSWTWREYVDAARHPEAVSLPALGFWRRADIVRICDTWSAAVGADHLHVVTVPASGSPPGVLLERFASLIGIDPTTLEKQPAWKNEMVGAAATEVLRRVNVEMDGRLNQGQHGKVIRSTLVPMLSRAKESKRIGLPVEEAEWVEDRSRRMVADLRERGYDVVGDLDELVPRLDPDVPGPEDVDEQELLATAVSALALLTEEYATNWWLDRPARPEGADDDDRGDRRSRVRARVFNAKVKAVSMAERSKLASKAVRAASKAEERAIERERKR